MAESTKTTNRSMEVSTPDPLADVQEGWKIVMGLTMGFVASMTLKAAVVLGIPDIIAKAGPGANLSLEDIAAQLPSESVNTKSLRSIMEALVVHGVFSATRLTSDSGKVSVLYGLTNASKLLVRKNSDTSEAPGVIMQMHEASQAAWHHLHESVLYGKQPFKAAHDGKNMWEYAGENPEYNKVVNDGMTSFSAMVANLVARNYHGLTDVKTLVDVGGGSGMTIGIIVAANPHIHGINFDLPHVVATAPSIPGVEHVQGSMFESVPSGDAIFMKHIMHDWDDENCIKILRNCQKALPENGKVIICDAVLPPEADYDSPFAPLARTMELVMLAHTEGVERTEEQWRQLVAAAGFSKINFVPLPDPTHSIIEALKC